MHGRNAGSIKSDIAGAGIDPENWRGALESIATACGCTCAFLSLRNRQYNKYRFPEDIFTTPFITGFSQEARKAYVTEFYTTDLFCQVDSNLKFKTPSLYRSYIDNEEFLRSTFYRNWLMPNNLEGAAGVEVYEDEQFRVILNVYYSPDTDIPQMLATLEHWREDVSRAVRRDRENGIAKAHPDLAENFLNHSTAPKLLIDRELNVLAINQHATKYIRETPTLVLRGTKIEAATELDTKRLRETVFEVMKAEVPHGERESRTISAGNGGNHPVFLIFKPFGPEIEFVGVPVDGLLALKIFNPAKKAGLALRQVFQNYGLTNNMCEICVSVVDGNSLSDIAATSGRNIHTLEDSFKVARGKLGVSSKQELVSMFGPLRYEY